jgi:hypothetical protein
MPPDFLKKDKQDHRSMASTDLATDYFQYLAMCFPVMCATDEFHFLPRAQAASLHYDKVEDLSPSRMSECVCNLKQYQKQCDLRARHEKDLETFIDLELLKANMAGALIELKIKETWCHNPLLYLKIAFIGLDHALSKPATEKKGREERILARLYAIPRLLRQGTQNVTTVPESYFQASLSMVNDCKAYLSELGIHWAREGARVFVKGLEKVRASLAAFDEYLQSLSPVPEEQFKVAWALETTLREHFQCRRSLSEIFEIALEEWHIGLEQLRKLQEGICSDKSWRELYDAYCPPEVIHLDTLSLYQQEIDSLRVFFQSRGFGNPTWQEHLQLCETPTYLRSIRGSASFGAALSGNTEERDVFYLTTRRPHGDGDERSDLLKKRLHREFRFLCAHETFPGHHVLDTVRRSLKNPVRRQIESPLFYEGWASYAESLLTEYGYVDDPMESLVAWKRRLWRAARCQIDVGLNTGKLNGDSAIELLTTVGFSPEEAQSQIHRFRLNPGYQLCYTLGHHEIARLKETHGATMGQEAFHEALLKGGELPFHLIEKRFARRRH